MKTIHIRVKANAELVALVARHFALIKSQITIKSGSNRRLKWIRLENWSQYIADAVDYNGFRGSRRVCLWPADSCPCLCGCGFNLHP